MWLSLRVYVISIVRGVSLKSLYFLWLSESKTILLISIDPILLTYITENNISVEIKKSATLGRNPKNDITKIIVEKLDKVLPSLDLK